MQNLLNIVKWVDSKPFAHVEIKQWIISTRYLAESIYDSLFDCGDVSAFANKIVSGANMRSELICCSIDRYSKSRVKLSLYLCMVHLLWVHLVVAIRPLSLVPSLQPMKNLSLLIRGLYGANKQDGRYSYLSFFKQLTGSMPFINSLSKGKSSSRNSLSEILPNDEHGRDTATIVTIKSSWD